MCIFKSGFAWNRAQAACQQPRSGILPGLQTKAFVALAFFALFLCVTTQVQAQTGRGAISGRVTDTSNGVLQGAQIALEQKSITGISDVQGQFLINGLEPGSYTVNVSY